MKNLKIATVVASIGISLFASAEEGLTKAQEAIAKAGPKNAKLLIAGFGTIESMTKVDAWLGEQLQPNRNLEELPTLSQGEKLQDPEFHNSIVRANWKTKKMEYVRDLNEIRSQNERNRQMLTALRTKVLTDDSTRYVPMGKNYLQAAIFGKAKSLIQIIDRSNADMNFVEQQLNGDGASTVTGVDFILTAALGDAEADSDDVAINAKGTKIKSVTYTQPYTYTVRDLQGNVVCGTNGHVKVVDLSNNIVKSTRSNPARKLMEKLCSQIADDVVLNLTTKLEFNVKVPEGMDEDDVEVKVDGKSVDVEDGVRVLAVEHAIVAELDGCRSIRKIVSIDKGDGSKTVKLKFKKNSAASED